jgi:hypothetical protein
LQEGKNSLLFFDEEGLTPHRVDIDMETPASRISSEWTTASGIGVRGSGFGKSLLEFTSSADPFSTLHFSV